MSLDCSSLNSLFQTESGRFSVDVRDRIIEVSPWQRFAKIGKFPLGMGATISDLTIERVLTDSVETDWSAMSLNNGSGVANLGCIPNPSDLLFGHTVRTWALETKSYRTPCICLDDLKQDFQIQEQIGKTVKTLTQLQQYVLDNRLRAAHIAVSETVSVRQNFPSQVGIDGSLPPPTSPMTQEVLNKFRRLKIRDGAGRGALGMENGAPVLGWITSDEASDDILRVNADVRQDIRYAQPSALVQPLGIDRSFRGLYHIIDPFIPRYTYTQGQAQPWTRIVPFVQSNATSGKKWDPNPAYEAAPFELTYLYHQDALEMMVQSVGPDIPGAPFTDRPEYYTGEFIWLNILHETNNPLGKIGKWLAIFTNAIRPVHPELANQFMAKRCENDPPLLSTCIYS